MKRREEEAINGHVWSIKGRAVTPRASSPPSTVPRASDGILVPQSNPFNPLGGHDTSGGQIVVDFRNIDSVSQTRLPRTNSAIFLEFVASF